MPSKPRLVILDGYCLNPGDLSWGGLEPISDVTVYDRTPRDLVVERAGSAVLALTNKTPLRRADFETLPALRYIGVLATGYDVVDIAAAAERGITVSNVPTYGTDSVAQFVFALLLELCHRTAEHAAVSSSSRWSRHPDWSAYSGALIELAGRTLGIVGFGRIGRRTAEIGAAFGMRILACDPYASPAAGGVEWFTLEELFRRSDVISLHCPLLPETRGLINAVRIQWMKSSAFLINTSRGGLVVDEDLAAALNSGRLAGAALDVLSAEPPDPRNPLLSARNCIVTPHMAWATVEARRRLMDVAVENVAAFLRGAPENVVAP